MSDLERFSRKSLDDLLGELARLETVVSGWGEAERQVVDAYRLAVDQLNREALRRLIRELREDPATLPALKRAAADAVVYTVLRHHQLVKPSLTERVEGALATVRPALAAHGGDVRLVNVVPPRVELEMIGSCNGCASSDLTLDAGLRKAIQEACPEITEVVRVGMRSR